ncbi:MBL fold metallo-hydrolase [Paenibacillus plantiphilus]|uniref:MBL fold metallo-hydrolase n=1 Tax=Paenibacillus plantiphilus TaxID=2905650 RepID=UPI001F1BAF2E|nr:MBL fold metallo-hydrolase [Paenibacillus plantiphilus]
MLVGCNTANPDNQSELNSAGVNEYLKVHFLDVGQGASQLIIGPSGHTMLIDAGNNDQESVVVDYLKGQGISRIDILVGTHPDADHVGGLDAVIDNFEIGKIYMPKVQSNTRTFEDVLLSIQRKGLKVATAKAGLLLDWESDVKVAMVAPVAENDDTNEMSAVIHITYGATSFLLTGDAESGSEQEMINSNAALKSDVLMVGHHGSNSSTTDAFVEAVQPSYAVIQVGQENNYGHPKAAVLERLNDNGIQVYRNDEQGDIVFTSNGTDITVTHSKQDVVNKDEKKNSPKQFSTLPATPEPSAAPEQQEDTVVYKNCREVRAAGKAPLHKGDPGYSTKLDGDRDGVACE